MAKHVMWMKGNEKARRILNNKPSKKWAWQTMDWWDGRGLKDIGL